MGLVAESSLRIFAAAALIRITEGKDLPGQTQSDVVM